jgi:hypothetical protein
VTPDAVSLEVGQGVPLHAFARDRDGDLLEGVTVRYRSEQPDVARVSEAGRVTGQAPGNALVRVWVSEGPEVLVPVAVWPVVDTIIVTPAGVTLRQGEELQLEVSVLDADGAEIPGAHVAYDASGGLTVTAQGLVQATGREGVAQVAVSSGQAVTYHLITVEAVPAAIVLSKDHFTLFPGQAGFLSASLQDITGSGMTALPLFTSSDPSLFSIAPHMNYGQFVVHAGGGTGEGTLTASYPGVAPVAVPVLVLEAAPISHREPMLVAATAAAISSTGRMVIGAGAGLYSGQLPGTAFTPLATGLAASAVVALDTAGTVAYSNAFLNAERLSIIDLATGERLQPESPTLNGEVFDVEVHPGTGEVYASSPWFLYRLTPDSLRPLAAGSGQGGGYYLATDFPRNRVYLADHYRETVLEFDAATFALLRRFPAAGVAQDMAVSPDGTRLFVTRIEQPLLALDLATGLPVASLQAATHGRHVALSPDGTRLAVTTSNGAILLLDLQGLALRRAWNVGGTPGRPAFSGDGQLVVAPNHAGWVDFLVP